MENQLIPIIEKDGQQLVNARELYEFLESKQEFANWIKNRIDKYGFMHGSDYLTILSKSIGGRPAMEYGLTIEMAKELCMVENNEKGKQARQYFISIEKKFKALDLDFSNPKVVLRLAQNWAFEQQKRIDAEIKVKALEAKTELMDRVLDSDEKIDIGQAAKILGLPFGRNTLFVKLREKGIFFKHRNEPLQDYIDRGYFLLKEKYIERNNHNGFVVLKVLVTQKGLRFLSNLFSVKPISKELAIIQ